MLELLRPALFLCARQPALAWLTLSLMVWGNSVYAQTLPSLSVSNSPFFESRRSATSNGLGINLQINNQLNQVTTYGFGGGINCPVPNLGFVLFGALGQGKITGYNSTLEANTQNFGAALQFTMPLGRDTFNQSCEQIGQKQVGLLQARIAELESRIEQNRSEIQKIRRDIELSLQVKCIELKRNAQLQNKYAEMCSGVSLITQMPLNKDLNLSSVPLSSSPSVAVTKSPSQVPRLTLIQKIEISPSQVLDSNALTQLTQPLIGQLVSRAALTNVLKNIQKLYYDKGYFNSSVKIKNWSPEGKIEIQLQDINPLSNDQISIASGLPAESSVQTKEHREKVLIETMGGDELMTLKPLTKKKNQILTSSPSPLNKKCPLATHFYQAEKTKLLALKETLKLSCADKRSRIMID